MRENTTNDEIKTRGGDVRDKYTSCDDEAKSRKKREYMRREGAKRIADEMDLNLKYDGEDHLAYGQFPGQVDSLSPWKMSTATDTATANASVHSNEK